MLLLYKLTLKIKLIKVKEKKFFKMYNFVFINFIINVLDLNFILIVKILKMKLVKFIKLIKKHFLNMELYLLNFEKRVI